MRTRTRAASMVLAACALAIGVSSPAAVAAPAAESAHIVAASKRPYGGQDPHYSGCSTWGARMVKHKTDYYYSSKYREHVWVKAELWYSSGCRTVWTEVHSNVPQNYAAGLGCNIHRKSDGKVLTCNHTTGTRERNSPMLNDKNTTGYAVAWGHIGDDPHILIATTGSY